MTVLSLTTKDAVRAFRGLTAAEPPDDPWLDSAIAACSARVEKALNRATLSAAQVETFDLFDLQRVICLRGYPVNTAQTFEVKHDVLHGFGTGSELTTALYHYDPDLGILELETDFAPGSRVLRVSYTGGMAASTAAFIAAFPDLAEAVAMQIAFWWESHRKLGQTTVGGPDGSVTVERPLRFLEPLEQAVLAHRRLVLL